MKPRESVVPVKKSERNIKLAIVIVTICLCILIVVKPRINDDYHVKYLDNLNVLDSLSDTLVRDHLLVRHGEVKHYDHLEADLQQMAKSAQLAMLPPGHTGRAFEADAIRLSKDYLARLALIRSDVELSKRGIGLLSNARSALALMHEQMNQRLLEKIDGRISSQAMATIIQLDEALRQEASASHTSGLLDRMSMYDLLPEELLAQIKLNTEVVERHAVPLRNASQSVYQSAAELDQAMGIRRAYLDAHQAVLTRAAWQLGASYVFAACLIALSISLMQVGTTARREAEQAMKEARQAKQETELRIAETRNAVEHCNHVLEKLSRGDFSDRVTLSFSTELTVLKDGVNSTADRVEFTMQELQRVMTAMQRGDFTTQIDERVTGEFRHQVEQTNTFLRTTMDRIGEVMEGMRRGEFSTRIDMELEGSFDTLKSSVNESLDGLQKTFLEFSTVVNRQAEGDFTHRVDADWPGELGKLSLALNSTAEKVHSMVSNIHRMSEQVAHASQFVLDNTNLMKSQSEQQAGSISTALETARIVSQLIDKNRESTHSAANLVERSRSDADQCRNDSEQATLAMQSITEKTAEISVITATIESIASKTNLLSLNAAVEAARANEHGKGFSVVAEEVKALARMSAEASANIESILQDTDSQVKFGTNSVRDTANSLANIGDSISNVRDLSKSISDASIEQMSEMNSMTVKVGEAFELTRINQSLAETTQQTSVELDKLANQMSSLVAFFRVDDSDLQTLSEAA